MRQRAVYVCGFCDYTCPWATTLPFCDPPELLELDIGYYTPEPVPPCFGWLFFLCLYIADDWSWLGELAFATACSWSWFYSATLAGLLSCNAFYWAAASASHVRALGPTEGIAFPSWSSFGNFSSMLMSTMFGSVAWLCCCDVFLKFFAWAFKSVSRSSFGLLVLASLLFLNCSTSSRLSLPSCC